MGPGATLAACPACPTCSQHQWLRSAGLETLQLPHPIWGHLGGTYTVPLRDWATITFLGIQSDILPLVLACPVLCPHPMGHLEHGQHLLMSHFHQNPLSGSASGEPSFLGHGTFSQ